MSLKNLVLLIVASFSLVLGGLLCYFLEFSLYLLGGVIIIFISFYLFVYFLVEKFIIARINVMYKLIHNLKLGKGIKDIVKAHTTEDPINDAEKEVIQWAKDKKQEIEMLKKQESFRRDFLRNIAHEFKTPLFAIEGYIEAILEDNIEELELRTKFLLKVQSNTQRLNALIQDLDEISKLESGELPINYTRFDIRELICEVIESLEIRAQKYQIKLFPPPKNATTYVWADREKVSQVLINLLDNSLKYGKKEGFTKINIFELHHQYLVEVTDNGIGIQEQFLPRIFERFFRPEQSRSRDIGGAGLGLAIVKHIIEAHQQTISVRSTEHLGSTFGFTLQKG